VRIHTYFSRQRYFEKRYRKYIAKIKRFKKGGSLLDVGCNVGLFLKVAREEGYSVKGVELNQACAAYARDTFNFEIYSTPLESATLEDESFDVVTLFDVLEHVPDIHVLMSIITKILKKDGLLVVQSPNIHSLMAKLTGSKWSWLTPSDHLYHFSIQSLTMLLRSHSFDPKRITTWEPAKDFSDNLITTYIPIAIVRRMLLLLNRITRVFTIPVFLVQRLWWRRQQGALIEVYAKKEQ
jgi:SAM-dependent methyltransferase